MPGRSAPLLRTGALVLAGGLLATGCAQGSEGTTRAHLRAAEIRPVERPVGASAEQANTKLVRGLYADVFSQHRLDRAQAYIQKDYLQHTPSVPLGLDGFKLFYQTVFFKTFPDVSAKIDQILAQNDKVVSFATWRGHQVGTGKPLVLHTADVYRVTGGKLAEHWDMIDYSALIPFGQAEPTGNEPVTPVDSTGSPAQRNNLVLGRRFFDEVVRAGQPGRMSSYLAPDMKQRTPNVAPGPAGSASVLREYLKAVPGLTATVDHMVADDDHVALFITWRGRQAGTGKQLHLHTADIYRVANGRFTEHWGTVDRAALAPLGLADG